MQPLQLSGTNLLKSEVEPYLRTGSADSADSADHEACQKAPSSTLRQFSDT